MQLRLRPAVVATVLAVSVALPARAQEAAPGDTPAQPPAPTKAPNGKHKKRQKTENEPVQITADQINQDRDLSTVTARGHVEVHQGGRTLLADSLSYNMKQDVIVATGNVSLTEATGEVTFADYIELTGDMKRAAAEGIRILMIDDSRVGAFKGNRIAGDRSVFDNGTYTACKPCAEDPTKPPLWELKANKVTHDEVKHLIEYEDAWLQVDGVPIAYTPYLSHADPTIKRESGLLAPGVINNNIVGSGVRVPYFQVIDPNQDITLAPMVTTKYGEMLAVTDRLRTTNGEAKTVASIADIPSTAQGPATVGWHVDAYSRFDLNDTWRAGWQIQRASSQTYLPTFGYITPLPYLTTRPYIEGFGYRNYASVEAYSFQSLTTVAPAPGSVQTKEPLVFPLGRYNYTSDPGAYGSYWTFDTHTAAITRTEGTDSRGVNTLTAWHLPYTTDDGQMYKLTTSLRADGYNSDNLTPTYTKQVNSGRVVPDISVDWRYPFTKVGEHSSQTITPIVVASASPYGGNPSKIPNEDSLDFELDDTNIFRANPASGYDRVVTGPRVAYGGQYTVVNRGLGAADFVLGQSYQLHPQDILPQGTGLDGHLSDIVGRAALTPSNNFSVQYDFRLDKNDFGLRRSELSTSIGPRPLNLQTGYVFYDRMSPTSPFNAREQISSTLSAQLTRHWSGQLYTVQNVGSNAQPLQTGARLTYEDECLLVTADGGESKTTLATVTSGHYLMLRVVFKTLTQFPVDVF